MGLFDRSRSDRDADNAEAGSSRSLWDAFFRLVMKKDLDGALGLLEKLENIEPANPQVYLKKAEILQRKDNVQGAVTAYYKAADTLEGGDRLNKAHAIYRLILRLKPDEATARTRLASPPVPPHAPEAAADLDTVAHEPAGIAGDSPLQVNASDNEGSSGYAHDGQAGGYGSSYGTYDNEGIELASLDGSDAEPEGETLLDGTSHEEQSYGLVEGPEDQGQAPGSPDSVFMRDDSERDDSERDDSDEEPQIFSGPDALDWGDVPAGRAEPASDMLSGLGQESASANGGGLNDSLDWGNIPAGGLNDSSMSDEESNMSGGRGQGEFDIAKGVPLSSDSDSLLEETGGPEDAGYSHELEQSARGISSPDMDGGSHGAGVLDEDNGETVSPLLQDSPETVSENNVPDIDPSLWEPPDMEMADAGGQDGRGGDIDENILPPIFSFLSVEDIEGLPERAAHRSYPSGSTVIHEGDSSDSMFIIKSGSARVETSLKGSKVVLGTLSPGDFFGEVAFLTGKPRTASVIAEGELETMEVNRALLQSVIDNNPLVLDGLLDSYKSRALDAVRRLSREI